MKKIIATICLILAAAVPANGEVKLAPIFSSNMVLQASDSAPIWGTSDVNEQIQITTSWDSISYKTQTNTDGRWMVEVKTPDAGGPYNITVKATNTIIIENILIGQVWLCSGQSNMFMPIGGIEWAPGGIDNAKEVLTREPQPMLRLFCDDGHELWSGKKWQVASSDTLKPFSATAYFFGLKLLKELNVPIGLINISRGGSPIQQWTPAQYNERVPITKKYSDLYVKNREQIDSYNQALNAYYTAEKNGTIPKPKMPEPLSGEIDAARGFYGSNLYDNLIEPIVPLAIEGVIWYQGEANAIYPEIAMHYDDMLKALIASWRDKWHKELPFYFVQLPAWGVEKYAQNWTWVRQCMLNVCQTVPNTGMAITIDVGDQNDIHPQRKEPVGERLALLALANTYDKPYICSGPLPVKVSNEGKDLRIHFDTFGSSLKLLTNQLDNLEVAGDDGVFYPATAVITQTEIIASCPQVKNPTSLRYGWLPYFEPTLFNTDGLPASPFYFIKTTDGSWHLATAANVTLR